jgi:hypothetical protein
MQLRELLLARPPLLVENPLLLLPFERGVLMFVLHIPEILVIPDRLVPIEVMTAQCAARVSRPPVPTLPGRSNAIARKAKSLNSPLNLAEPRRFPAASSHQKFHNRSQSILF